MISWLNYHRVSHHLISRSHGGKTGDASHLFAEPGQECPISSASRARYLLNQMHHWLHLIYDHAAFAYGNVRNRHFEH